MGIGLNKNPKIFFYSRKDIDDFQIILGTKSEDVLTSEEVEISKEAQIKNPVSQMSQNQILETGIEMRETQFSNTSSTGQTFEYVGDGLFFDIEESRYLTFDEVKARENEMDDIYAAFDTVSKKSLKNFYYSKGRKILPIEGVISPKMLVDFFGIAENHYTENSIVSLKSGSTEVGYLKETNAALINAIYIPEIPFKSTKVIIKGLVKSPGTYDLPIGTTLNDLYTIVDGFLDQADTDSIIFLRESIKQNEMEAIENSKQLIFDSLFNAAGEAAVIGNSSSNSLLPLVNLASNIEPVGRLTGDLQKDSILAKNLILEDGDVIEIVPKRTLVTITGQVLQPLTVAYDESFNLDNYISLSGGLTQYADKKSIYIIRKNGTSVPFDSRLFVMGTNILPGDTIVIPRDLERLSPLPLVRVATSVISDIAFAAASLNSLRN